MMMPLVMHRSGSASLRLRVHDQDGDPLMVTQGCEAVCYCTPPIDASVAQPAAGYLDVTFPAGIESDSFFWRIALNSGFSELFHVADGQVVVLDI